LDNEAIEQLHKILAEFRVLFPDFALDKLYGMLAVVDASPEALESAWKRGFLRADGKRRHDADASAVARLCAQALLTQAI